MRIILDAWPERLSKDYWLDAANLTDPWLEHPWWGGALDEKAKEALLELLNVLSAGRNQTTSINAFAQSHVVFVIAAIALLLIYHRLVYNELVTSVRLMSSESLQSAVSSILTMLCDAVIQLGPYLEVLGLAAKMVNLLHMPPGKQLRGSLPELIPEAVDKVRVGDVLRDSARNSATIHSTFRDAFGVLVQVELFCTAFQNLAGERC